MSPTGNLISQATPVPWYWHEADLFADADPEVRADFEACSDVQTFRARQPIFHANDAADRVFLLERGMVKIYHLSAFGDVTIFWFCMPGDLFGAGGISGSLQQSVYGQAVDTCRVRVLPRATFENLVRTHPQLGLNVIRFMGARLRLACDAATDHVTRRADARLARILLRLAQQCGRLEGDATKVDAPVTNQELANMVGATRQTVNQLLKQFERAGWLRFEQRRLVVLEPQALARCFEEDGRAAKS